MLEAVRQFLSRIDFLKHVPGEVIDKLARIAVPRELGEGDQLWGEGDGLYFVIVWRGQLEVRKNGGLIDIMLASQTLGHSALRGRKHTATVIAAVDSHVLRFDAARVYALARDHSALMDAVLDDVLALVSKLNRDLGGSKGPLRRRLRHCLSWLSRGRKQTRIDITHKQLAELTGSTHYSVSRELKQMADAGALRTGFRFIEIIDMDLDKSE
jgi:CRP-like cAMP-binding protein